jgi:hypothetical protein
MSNWWVDEQGRNNLAGVEESETNPPVLSVDTIVEFLTKYAPARQGFRELIGTMRPEEQERLNAIVQQNPRALVEDSTSDPKIQEDLFQRALNQVPFIDPNRRR